MSSPCNNIFPKCDAILDQLTHINVILYTILNYLTQSSDCTPNSYLMIWNKHKRYRTFVFKILKTVLHILKWILELKVRKESHNTQTPFIWSPSKIAKEISLIKWERLDQLFARLSSFIQKQFYLSSLNLNTRLLR